ncbi:MAG: CRISPR-associated protein Csm3 [Chloroflexi bacterium]|nr:CRISPR-associated protein Csm3 [Chloroflexota bacterium]
MQVQIRVEWLSESALSVGSTADAQGLGVDKATARDNRGRLLIPASSIKGRLRHECERIERTLGGFVCLPPRAEQMCPLAHPQGQCCAVCEIFGSPWRPAPLRLSDGTLLLASLPEPIRTERELRPFDAQVRPGVSLSRARRAALGERLFFIETSAPNAGFRFQVTLEGELPSTRHRALLLAGLRCLSLLGGGKSRGLGWGRVVRWTVDGVEADEAHLAALIAEGGYG